MADAGGTAMSSVTTLVPATSSPGPQQDLDHDNNDEDEPTIPTDLYRFIHSLDESPGCYSRFFSALLIRRDSHGLFFADLKAFREQPVIIAQLQKGSSEAYRQVTRNFVGSRFAHPWCRTNSDFKSGWIRGSWVGSTKRVSKEDRKEEERLHRLLVPVWIAFRRRMFPTEEALEQWVEQEEVKKRERLAMRSRGAGAGEESRTNEAPSRSATASAAAGGASAGTTPASTESFPELGFKIASSSTARSTPDPSADSEGAAAATKMMVGLAVTGFIMSDKRVRKYVEKKLKKRRK